MSVTLVPSPLRRAVIELHGTRCLRCGVQCTPDWWSPTSLHIDHVIPEAHGGPTTLDNLQVLCAACNLAKGATYADYRRARPPTQKGDRFTGVVAALIMTSLVLGLLGGFALLGFGLVVAICWLVLCWLVVPVILVGTVFIVDKAVK